MLDNCCIVVVGSFCQRSPNLCPSHFVLLQLSDVNDQLDVMSAKLRGSYDDSTPGAATPGRGETPSPGWVQNGVDYMQHLWAWETRPPFVQPPVAQGHDRYERNDRHERSTGLDRGQIEAIVRAAVQKQLSDLGVQAGVSGAGAGDARFVSTRTRTHTHARNDLRLTR